MTDWGQRRRLLVSLLAITAIFAGRDIAEAQTNDSTDLSIELIDPKVLRVCADPRNLPFSNDKGEGIENKLGELFAAVRLYVDPAARAITSIPVNSARSAGAFSCTV